ncbi:signal recognition particle-docking protein FtsY [Photobacterium aquimaris]|uniref:Signal recognition particle receptor FtsY n=1 Tax=Photobacterium aquimaris TaxID=512643 RepID=A0A2T3IJN0_9GAMM|nr:signal recognition particle-docking protein FtsY [Photobacterium aquimaris]OBU09453.1 signal recognition particle-docking protein FtsY [Photobacterium aquimaris]OBU13670.1 signal recognition particle-docking protein FtsY [Photobacterium aquimaris]PSU28559.1 signal recognition particle-docking protein FtsY [Photobacterium aquimaris]PSW01039.1 signal recognition particle-docking protein FtsY [Photobacterium aquimaris]
MAEKKKRGLFSWLGFSSEDNDASKEQATEQSVVDGSVDSPKSTHSSDDEGVKASHNHDIELDTPIESELIAETNDRQLAATLQENDQQNDTIVTDSGVDDLTDDVEKNKKSENIEANSESEPSLTANADTADEANVSDTIAAIDDTNTPVAATAVEQEKPKSEGFFSRLMRGLKRTKTNFGAGFFGLFRGKQIDDELFEELEEQLLIADVGMDTTLKIINNLTDKASRRDLNDGEALYGLLKDELGEMLAKVEQPLVVDMTKKPYVILMVGVNGVGKTTTIGKLAKQFQAEGKSVMLAAGDTFRAAAVEQLQVWGERNNVPVIAQHTGADSASVIFDAIESAKAKNVDVVIADTAGRLQNKGNLMEELRKIVRVMQKVDIEAPHEIMLTVDAGTGQNAISQAKLFSEVAPVSGITITKLDGTAKGGVIFAIADQFNIPIRYIGIGEGIDDLRPFAADEFIEALFSNEE